MASAPSPDTVTIVVNDVPLEVPRGEMIVESVKRIGLEIPIFCYHPRMKPVGMCRMCLVEVGFKQPDGSVRKMPKPQAACTLPASEGLVVYTDTEAVHKDRRGVLEFLLINHPLDCPICDRGGECPLQNNTLFYGPSTSRYLEPKRHAKKAYPLSKYVTLDLERCIHCGRCVRFTEEVSGDSQLAFRFRGAGMQPSTYQLTDFESKFSGNVIEICPVGALTSTTYRFRARPWDLETAPAICTLCSNHCNVWFDHRPGKFVRMNGRVNEAVNEEWTCDRGKFGQDFHNSPKRLTTPLVRKGDAFVPATWGEAYSAILSAFGVGGNKVAALVGTTVSNEGLYLLQKLFRGAFKSNNLDYRSSRHQQKAADRLESKLGIAQVQTPIADYEKKSCVLLFGSSLADEEPILYLRLRKAATRYGVKVVVAHHVATEAEGFATLTLRYKPGAERALAQALLNGGTAEETGVPEAAIREAAAMLDSDSVVLTTHALLNVDGAQECLEALGSLAKRAGAQLNCYARKGNNQGAEDMGVLPDLLPGLVPLSAGSAADFGYEVPSEAGLGAVGILAGCAEGSVEALWVVGSDPASLGDPSLVERALENVPFLVYQGLEETETMGYASVVLPMEAPAEQDGTYTNMERRVQRMKKVIDAPGDAKQAWRVFAEVMLQAQPSTPYFNAREVMDEIARVVPGYASATYENLDGEGVLVGTLGLGEKASV